MQSHRRSLTAALALALWVAAPALGQAEEPVDEPKPELAAEAEVLLEQLDAARSRQRELRDKAIAASGTPRQVLEEQAGQVMEESGRILKAIAQNLLDQQEAGFDTREAKKSLQRDIEAAWPRTLTGLGRRAKSLDELVAKRDAAAPEERLSLETELTALSRGILRNYVLIVESLLALEEAGVELEEQRTFLEKELAAHAEYLAASARVAVSERDQVQAQLDLTPGDSSLLAALPAAEGWADRASENLSEVATLMESLGMDTTPYRQLLFESTGEITAEVLDQKVALGLLDRWRGRVTQAVSEHGPRWLLKALVFFGILFAFRIAANAIRRVVTRSLAPARVQVSQLLRDSLVSWSARAVMLLGILVALSQLGIEIGPMLAGLGIVGFILGFAMQDSLSNFAAGGMILIYRPFDVDDLIEAAGVRGAVQRMTLVSTTILTLDNQTLIVPNSKIWGDVIRNVTAQRLRRIDLVFGISYESSVDQADEILRAILKGNPRVLDEPEARVEVHELGESSVDFVVRPWVKTEDYWEAHWEITREVKKRFDAAGISIPYPQRDVHLRVPAAATGEQA